MQRHLAAGSTVIAALMAAHRPTQARDPHPREQAGKPSIDHLLAMMGKSSFQPAQQPAACRQSPGGPPAE